MERLLSLDSYEKKKKTKLKNRKEEKALTIIVTDAVCKLLVYKRCGEEKERESVCV